MSIVGVTGEPAPRIEPFIKDKGTWNSVLPKEPEEAARRLEQRLDKKATRKTTHIVESPKKRQFNFLNITDRSILEYVASGPTCLPTT